MKQIRLTAFIVILSTVFFQGYTQVSMQTGAAEFSLPLFSYDGNDRLHTAVSLNYLDGNGLKVDEISSAVGTGWGLQAGGVISRQQKGLPDDQCRTPPLANPLPDNLQMSDAEYLSTYFPNGYLFSAYSPSDVLTNEGGYVRTQINLPYSQARIAPEKEIFAADREQDIFRLDLGKGSVEFVINKGLSVTVLNDSKIKIEFALQNMLSSHIKTWISEFTVTDVDGIKYIFSGKELAQTCTYEKKKVADALDYTSLDEGDAMLWSPAMIMYPGQNPSFPNALPRSYVNIGKRTGNFIVSKWHLTKIINPLTNKEIVFSYDVYDCEMQTERIMTYTKTASVTILKQILKPLRLKKIDLPNSQKVDFVYDDISQTDVLNQKPLKKIIVSDNDKIVDQFDFEYQYFFADQIKPYNFQFNESEKFLTRLSLKSIQKKSTDNVASEAPYLFDYYITDPQIPYSAVPPMFSYLTDHWGYSNRSTVIRNGIVTWYYMVYNEYPSNRIPSYEAIKYECTHTATVKVPLEGMAKFGIIKQITYPHGGNLSFDYEQNNALFNNQNVLTGGVRVKNYTFFDGVSHTNDISKDIKYVKEDGIQSSGWGYENQNYQRTVYTRIYPQSSTNVSKTTLKDFATSFVLRGLTGRRGATQPAIYFAKSNVLSTVSNYGISMIVNALISLFNSPPPLTEKTDIEYHNISYQKSNPVPSLYARVELIDKANNTESNGKSVFEYTSDQDMSLMVPVIAVPFYNQKRYFSSFYGLLKRTAVFDNTGFLLKENFTEYQLTSHQGSMSMEWLPVRYVYDEYPWMTPVGGMPSTAPNQFGDILSNTYYSFSDHTTVTSTKERLYNKFNSGFIENKTDYTYNSNNDQIKTKSTYNSKGNLIETKYYYPADYNVSSIPVLGQLISNNIITVPVSIETWQTKINQAPEIISNSVTEFSIAANGDLKPVKNYELQAEKPLSLSDIGLFNTNSLIRNTNFIKPVTQTIYDTKGNSVQLNELQKNSVSCNIYNSNDLSIASIVNASYNETGYTSFEAFSEANGNIMALPVISAQQSPTGISCGNLAAGLPLKFSIPVLKESILSLWATPGSIQINSAPVSPSVTGATINGWTFYQFVIPANTPAPVITGNCKIDEVRLYPKNASMSTATYETGKGKTADCNNNNQITYYEYDGLGRLTLTRDQYRMILKKICYNYAGQPEDCPLFTNTQPQWRATGQTRCQICSVNNNYTSSVREREERDINPNSPAYGNLRWAVDPTGTCATVPDWQPRTDLAFCETDGSEILTGNKITPTYDANPCSSSWQQWGPPVSVPDASCLPCIPACPDDPHYKCINGDCISGEWKIVRVRKIDKFTWQCTSGWCFPDGTVTGTQSVYSSTPCTLQCF